MGSKTAISWAGATWNPLSGCNDYSPECANCYAREIIEKNEFLNLKKLPQYADVTKLGPNNRSQWTGVVKLNEKTLLQPLHWKKPSIIFVNSMSDTFHEKAKIEWQDRMFEIMCRADWHFYLVLTKRIEIAEKYFRTSIFLHNKPPRHIAIGTSVGTQESLYRVEVLQRIPAAMRFLSVEPLLEAVDLKPYFDKARQDESYKIDEVYVGGESGEGARPMHPDWVEKVYNDCMEAGVTFHFKQWGEWRFMRRSGRSREPAIMVSKDREFRRVGKKRAGHHFHGVEMQGHGAILSRWREEKLVPWLNAHRKNRG